MVKKVSDPVKRDRSLSAPCRSLDHQDLVFRIPDDRILFLLYSPDDVFQLHISVISQFLLQDLIIDLCITLKGIDHLSPADLVLPF